MSAKLLTYDNLGAAMTADSHARATRAKYLVLRLRQAGKTPGDISEDLDGRVTARTVYRWSKGCTAPQQRDAIALLEGLVESAERESVTV